MRTRFTAVYVEQDGWVIGYVEEIPGAHSQGRTVEEARAALREVLTMTLADNRERTGANFKYLRVIKREGIEPPPGHARRGSA